jgi:hypothetical protein
MDPTAATPIVYDQDDIGVGRHPARAQGTPRSHADGSTPAAPHPSVGAGGA